MVLSVAVTFAYAQHIPDFPSVLLEQSPLRKLPQREALLRPQSGTSFFLLYRALFGMRFLTLDLRGLQSDYETGQQRRICRSGEDIISGHQMTFISVTGIIIVPHSKALGLSL